MIKYILCFMLSVPAYATQDVDFVKMTQLQTKVCEQPVQYLLEKQTAPCTGYLFSPKKEFEVRIMKERFEIMEDLTLKQRKVINIMDHRIENLQKYNTHLSKELDRRDSNSFWKNAFYFGLGALLTGAIAANVK